MNLKTIKVLLFTLLALTLASFLIGCGVSKPVYFLFTALFAIADSMAIGAMRALRDAGRRIPEDCSVIAIDGLELSAYIEPPLTTLCQPMEEMGRRSAQILLGMLRGHGSHCCEVLPTQLREGGSVRSV